MTAERCFIVIVRRLLGRLEDDRQLADGREHRAGSSRKSTSSSWPPASPRQQWLPMPGARRQYPLNGQGLSERGVGRRRTYPRSLKTAGDRVPCGGGLTPRPESDPPPPQPGSKPANKNMRRRSGRSICSAPPRTPPVAPPPDRRAAENAGAVAPPLARTVARTVGGWYKDRPSNGRNTGYSQVN